MQLQNIVFFYLKVLLKEQMAIIEDARLALQTSETRLKAILDNSPLLISEVDLDGRYLLINNPIAQFFQLPRSEIIGKTFVQLLPSEIARTFLGPLEQVKNLRRPIDV